MTTATLKMHKGMTLIEILVVIAIIGIVATVVAVGVVGYLEDAKIESTKTLVNNVAKGVSSYTITAKLPSRSKICLEEPIKKNSSRTVEQRPGL